MNTSRCLIHRPGFNAMKPKAFGYFIKHAWANKSEIAMCLWFPPETYEDRRDVLVKKRIVHPSIRHRKDLENRYGAVSKSGVVHLCECRYEKGEREATNIKWWNENREEMEATRDYFSKSDTDSANT